MDFLEQHIIEKLKAGDGKAMEYIFNSYFKPLYNYACSLTRSDFEAEEIVSNIYLKLWETRASVRIDTSIKSYLFKAAYHSFLDRQKHYEVVNKHKAFFLYHQSGENSSYGEYPLSDLIYRELDKITTDTINTLPMQCRQMFLMSRDEGMTHEQIAVHFKVSINTVHTQITRALQKLRIALAEYLPIILLLLAIFHKHYD